MISRDIALFLVIVSLVFSGFQLGVLEASSEATTSAFQEVGFGDQSPELSAFLDSREGIFLETQGQPGEDGIFFVFDSPGCRMGFGRSSYFIKLPGEFPDETAVVDVEFVGARPVEAQGQERLPGRINYFHGSDPSNWKQDLPGYSSIVYRELYPGIDLVLSSLDGKLKSDFLVHPGADPADIILSYSGTESLGVDESGNLLIETGSATLVEEAPVSFQEGAGGLREEVLSSYDLSENSVSFFLGDYDDSKELTIDPLLYSTYIGSSGGDSGYDMALGEDGSIYLAGVAGQTDFPVTAGSYDDTGNGSDVFVMRLSPDGKTLEYSTFVGGTGQDGRSTVAMTVDDEGNIYVTGCTLSDDFPTTPGSFDDSYNGGRWGDAFLFKLSADGSKLIFSTYIGGSGNDYANDISLGPEGHIYLAGRTNSTDFPTTSGSFDEEHNGGSPGAFDDDAFLLKMKYDGSELVYSSYVGGRMNDYAYALCVDEEGNAYITGSTRAQSFPTTDGAYDEYYANSQNYPSDAFVTKMNPEGTELVYSTFLGMSESDWGTTLVLDPDNRVHLSGSTSSEDFPTTPGCYDDSFSPGSSNLFFAILSEDGSSLEYSSFFGGDDIDYTRKMIMATDGSIYLSGYAYSHDFPTTEGCFDDTLDDEVDGFLVRFSPGFGALEYSTLLGGSNQDIVSCLTLDQEGNLLVSGQTSSDDLPVTPGCLQDSYQGNQDAFLVKLDTSTELRAYMDTPSFEPVASDTGIYFSGHGTTFDGEIIRYAWESDLDGELYNGSEAAFTSIPLSVGTHNITLRVQNSSGSWSPERRESLVVTSRPVVTIDDVSPSPGLNNQTIRFSGHADDDGEIVRYVWHSSIDGEFYNGSGTEAKIRQPPRGEHVITLRVQDELGFWGETSQFLRINGTTDAPPPEGGRFERDWIISTDQYYENCQITLVGNLTIEDIGSLTFRDVSLKLESTAEERFWIKVLDGGKFTVLDEDDDPETWGDASRIISVYDDFSSTFTVEQGGSLEMRNSEAHLGSSIGIYSNSSLIDHCQLEGIFCEGVSPTISNSSFDDRIYLREGSEALVENCSFQVEDRRYNSGVYSSYSSPVIRNCSFYGPEIKEEIIHGVETRSGETRIINCTFQNLTWGVRTGSGGETWVMGSYFTDCSAGVACFNTRITVTDSIFFENSNAGRFENHCYPVFENCSFLDTGGLGYLQQGEITVRNSTISPVSGIGSGWSRFTLENCSIETAGESLTISGTVSFVDTVHDREKVSIYSDSSLTVDNHISVRVEDHYGSPFQGAKVKIRDGSGDFDEEFTTDRDGWVSWVLCRSYSATEEEWTNVAPYTVRAEYQGNWNETETSLDGLTTLVLRVGSYHPPEAVIDIVSQNDANEGKSIRFEGHGETQGAIKKYEWSSSLDGHLSSSPSFETASLSNGSHTISFRVQDNWDSWGEAVTRIVTVNGRPRVRIESVAPSPGVTDYTTHFLASGVDDGEIARYVWSSSLDGEFYNGSSKSFGISSLFAGEHEISLKVQDDHGVWSGEASHSLTIIQAPQASIGSVAPSPSVEGETILFSGKGSGEGTITRYAWRSSIDGEFYNGTRSSFDHSSLSPGEHTIFFKVRDNNGFWSPEEESTLVVEEEEDTGSSLWLSLGLVLAGLAVLGFLVLVRQGSGKEYEEEEDGAEFSEEEDFPWDETSRTSPETKEPFPEDDEGPEDEAGASPPAEEKSITDEESESSGDDDDDDDDDIILPMTEDEDEEDDIILPMEEKDDDDEVIMPMTEESDDDDFIPPLKE